MSFFLQLRMLVWKNYTIRKRQKGRLLVEIVWPLFLFIILMFIRSRGLKTRHHQCYFEEKSMPSSGGLEFFRSFVCTFNNTCHSTSWKEARGWNKYNASFLNELLDNVEEAIQTNFDTQEKSQALKNVIADQFSLAAVANRLAAGNVMPPLNGFEVSRLVNLFNDPTGFLNQLQEFMGARNMTVSPDNILALLDANFKPELIQTGEISEIFTNPTNTLCNPDYAKKFVENISISDLSEVVDSACRLSSSDIVTLVNLVRTNLNQTFLLDEFDEFLELNGGSALHYSDWRLMAQVLSSLVGDLSEYSTVKTVYRDVVELVVEVAGVVRDLASFASNINSAEENQKPDLAAFSGLSRLVCGRNLSLNSFSSGGTATPFDELRDRLQKTDQESKYIYDNSTSKECNDLMKGLEDRQGVRFLWSQVKPFLRGKILFTPDTPVTRKLIDVVNKTFEPFQTLQDTIRELSENYSSGLREALLNPLNQLAIKNFFVGESGPFNAILDALENQNVTFNRTGISETLENYFQGDFSESWERSLNLSLDLVSNVSTYLDCFEMDKFEPTETETDLEKRGLELITANRLWAGLVFPDFTSDMLELPRFVDYKIRIDADKVDSTKRIEDRLTRKGPRRRPGIDLKYFYYGFGYLQDLVERAIIHLQTGRALEKMPGISLQQMPYPCYIEDRFVIAIARTFPLFMTLAWVYSASMIVKSIVHEKELRLKETMRVMGLGNGVHWISWFIDSFSAMSVSSFLLTLILVYGNILENSDPSLVFCFMLCYTIATIMLAFLLSTLFSRANIAAAAGGILFFILYLPYSFMVVWEESLDPIAKILSCLISNISFGFGCAYFSHFEESGIGAQWDNIWVSPLLGDTFSLAGCMGMLLLDAAIYGILTWYIEAVFPGEFGVPKPWYFFLTLHYWTGRNSVPQFDSESELRLGEAGKRKQMETEPTHLNLGVSIKRLHKVYNNGKVAVEDLNLNFYEGQITSFLGHNGAGKTTTISILTGLFPPSAGTALINGLDITRDMDKIRSSMGTCPQHNVLFPGLTIEEHLWFFARIKNQPKGGIQPQISQMILDLGIPHKRHEYSKNLSGGMQRKLSIACAFVGGSKVVVLDEPTAGVDPYSRRAIWDLLIKYKENRTIILTTHFMDEADLLGDRIAIINCGKLVCCGSSLFLKSLYGVGYYLTLVKSTKKGVSADTKFTDIMRVKSARESADSAATTRDVEDLETDNEDDDEGISDISTQDTIINPSDGNNRYPVYPLTKFIQQFVPKATLVEEIGQEIVFVLPVEESKEVSMKQFEVLFHELDNQMSKFKISTYGLSDTTLEEIFLQVASNENDGVIVRGEGGRPSTSTGVQLPDKLRKRSQVTMDVAMDSKGARLKPMDGNNKGYTEVPLGEEPEVEFSPASKNPDPIRKKTGKPLVLKHILALEVKRFHHSKRNKKGFICEIILPAAFVCLAMAFTQILPPLVEEPPLELTPSLYPSARSKGGDNHVFYSNNANHYGSWADLYEEQLLSKDGMGTECIGEKASKCDGSFMDGVKDKLKKYNTSIDDSLNPECSCSVGTQVCPAGAFSPTPPQTKVSTGDVLINLTGRNISQWLIKTRDQYYKQRYGGFEFGVRNPLADRNVTLVMEVINRVTRAANQGQPIIDGLLEDSLWAFLVSNLSPYDYDNIRVWFNNKGWAASVTYMNALNNIILRTSLLEAKKDDSDAFFDFDGLLEEKYDTSQYGIRLSSHPMNYTSKQLDKELIRQVGISLLHAICIIFAMSFVPASFVVFHIEERVNKIKHLHFVSGVGPRTYWVAAWLWDMVMYIAAALLCIFIFMVFDAKAYVSEENIGPLVLLMLLYGFSSVPLMYPASFVFSVPSSAFVTLACLNLFIGIITTVTTFVLENFDDEELKYIGSICKKVFLVFPHYCLGRGLIDMASEQSLNSVIAQFGLQSVRNRYEFDFLGKYFLWMFVQGIVFFTATLAIQSKFWRKLARISQTSAESDELDELVDIDVETERNRVLSSLPGDSVLQVRNLFKRYSSKGRQAVDRLTFGVGKGECFGLLGVNGAGKTTTFKMLTGDTDVTSGEAFVNGHSILKDMDAVRSSLGYCPQFDALDPLLTGREHLRLYARLRGLDEHSVKAVTEAGLQRMGLVAYSDRCAGTYSGGNKRKLSTAIALVGNPSIVFLDEPTSGMDPGARRFLWNSILEIIKGGQSVVLTSHSMEECEALCSTLGIMVNGQFKCIGSTQHLKNRFGSGYTLTIRCEEGKSAQVKEKVGSLLPLAELKEEHHNQLLYQLPLTETKLPLVFRNMEDCRAAEFLEDYSLSQTTLDEVFVRFASEQTDQDEFPPSSSKNLRQRLRDKVKC